MVNTLKLIILHRRAVVVAKESNRGAAAVRSKASSGAKAA